MADVVVSALANKTVDIATNLIINEGSRLYWLSEDINWLERQLRHMQSYLEDAEAKKVSNPKVENLLKDIRDLAYDVEDVLDTFLPKIELHRAQCSIKRAATILPYSHTCSGFAREIEKIKRRVEGIDADRKTYGVEGTSGGSDKFNVDPRTTALHFDEPIIVGIDKDIEELKMKLLSHEEEEDRVVSIVGMAGLGKTTLAKKVFGFVKHRIDCSASISVSQDPNVKSLLQDIAKQVGMEEKKREENIEANLYSFLQTKRTNARNVCDNNSVVVVLKSRMSMRIVVVFNPEALEMFVVQKVFVAYSWLKANDIPKPRLKAKDMARLLGFGIGDDLFDLVDKQTIN